MIKRQETAAEFGAFLAGVDRTLTAQYGPDHQRILAGDGIGCRSFEWSAAEPPKRIDPG